MTEQETSVAEDVENAISTPDAEESQTETPQEQEKTVPLSALEAERKKRQEEERRRQTAEQQNYLIQQQIMANQQKSTSSDDEDDYTKGIKTYAQTTAQQQIQNAMEQMYIQQNPGVLERLQNDLPELYQRRPELKLAIQNSPNRVLAAAQFLDDYAPRNTVSNQTNQKKIEENMMKPKSPHGSGKTAKLSKADMISKMTSEEFHRYRKEISGRR